jgi:hypothetical protein
MPSCYFGITTVVGRFRFLTGTTFVEDNKMFSCGVPYPREALQTCAGEYGLLAVPQFSLGQLHVREYNGLSFAYGNRMRRVSSVVGGAHWTLLSRCPTSLLPFLEYDDMEQMLGAARADSLPTFYDLVVALAVGAVDGKDMEERARKRRNDQESVSILFCLDRYGESGSPHILTIDWLMKTVAVDALQLGAQRQWYDGEGVVARATDFAYVRLP